MKQVINQNRVNRNALLANAASVGGLIVLLASVAAPLFLPALAGAATVLLITGLGTAMVGIYFANRWVRKPRPEARLSQELKGLGSGFVSYHYPRLPIDHILLTPFGLYVLETINLAGSFQYRDGKWKENMTVGRALRYIVEEHLGNPSQTAQESAAYLRGWLARQSGVLGEVPIQPAVVFVHPGAHLDVKGAPVPVVMADKLRKQVHAAGPKLPESVYEALRRCLETATV